jgi:hypothetical protein
MRPDHPRHNPFFNRFHVPVHRRHDDLEVPDTNEPNATKEDARDRFGDLFGLLMLAISFVLMLRAL